MIKNENRVPKKQWDKWTENARGIFNKAYDFLYYNQPLTTHPKTKKIPSNQWKTIAWNAAWIAADACDDTIPTEIVMVG